MITSSRDYFFEKIGAVMESEDIYIVSADLAGRPFDYIRKAYPTRYVSVGIAEQNMISVACGIALSGKKVIAYASNPFAVFHAFDQARNAVALMNLPVTIVGVGVGFSISEFGNTHFVTEDFAMMSLCPGVRTVTVTDNSVAERAYGEFLRREGPVYLRFDKACGEPLAETSPEDYNRGFRYLKRGRDRLVLSTGHLAKLAKAAPGGAAVVDLFAYPFDEDALIDEVSRYGQVYVYEEQQTRGGLGSAVLETLNRRGVAADVTLKGVDYGGRFPEVYGSREYWLRRYGLAAGQTEEE